VEWCVLIAVILRDAHAFTRAVNLACLPETGAESVRRLSVGMAALLRWSDSECLGYKPFLHSIRSQLEILDSLLRLNAAASPAQGMVDGRQQLTAAAGGTATSGAATAECLQPDSASGPEGRAAATAHHLTSAAAPTPTADRRADDSSTDSGSSSDSSSGCSLQ